MTADRLSRSPRSPFPLAWLFCVAGAIVTTAAIIVTASFRALTGAPPFYYGYHGPPYYPPSPYFAPEGQVVGTAAVGEMFRAQRESRGEFCKQKAGSEVIVKRDVIPGVSDFLTSVARHYCPHRRRRRCISEIGMRNPG